MPERAVILITGIQAAGKSTVAQLLAERLPRSVHLRGDVFRKMIVSGQAGMTPDAPAEAVRQLRLRHQLTAAAADLYSRPACAVVAQDVILGEHLAGLVAAMQRAGQLLVVVLAPQPGAVAAREAARAKTAYGPFTVAQLDEALRRETPRIGLWLDTSQQGPAETVAEILARAWTDARVN